MQRFEDFDGRFDRQIVGIERRLGTDWRVALAGDIQGSKAESDVQIEASWAHRDEHLGCAGMHLRTGARHHWEPTLYFGHVDADRQFEQLTGEGRQESEWVGKLALPWRYVVDEEANALLTVNLTIRLHDARFGGGNIQLHWPL